MALLKEHNVKIFTAFPLPASPPGPGSWSCSAQASAAAACAPGQRQAALRPRGRADLPSLPSLALCFWSLRWLKIHLDVERSVWETVEWTFSKRPSGSFLNQTQRLLRSSSLGIWGSVRVLWLSQDPEVRVPSFAGPRVLHEAKEVAAGALGQSSQCRDRPCSSRLHAGGRAAGRAADPPQLGAVPRYTMFSAPGSGPCGGPRSCLLCS